MNWIGPGMKQGSWYEVSLQSLPGMFYTSRQIGPRQISYL